MTTQKNAPEADVVVDQAPGAQEDDMMHVVVERGKASGNATRARRRAERAIREGRVPGQGGRPPGLCELCEERHARAVRCELDALLSAALRARGGDR